jgi:F-type H+-transporting ATPase subunit b
VRTLAADAGLLTVNGTLIAEIIVFLVMLGIMAKWVYPPVMRLAEQREKTIEAALRQAQEAETRLTEVRGEVERMLEDARAQAREVLARAHRDATAEAEEVRTKARRDAEAFLARAQNDIIAERDRALRELRSQIGTLVVAAAGKVIGDAIDAKAHEKLIERSLEAVESLPR